MLQFGYSIGVSPYTLRDFRFGFPAGLAAAGLRRARGRGAGFSAWRPGIQGEPKRRQASHMDEVWRLESCSGKLLGENVRSCISELTLPGSLRHK